MTNAQFLGPWGRRDPRFQPARPTS